jgi:hypothetical protein
MIGDLLSGYFLLSGLAATLTATEWSWRFLDKPRHRRLLICLGVWLVALPFMLWGLADGLTRAGKSGRRR